MILIALGANLPGPDGRPPRATLEAVLDLLPARGVEVRRRSRWWRTAPVPDSGQPWFVNGVASVRTGLEPAALLALLHELERAAGRLRTVPNAARSCDLDLLDYEGRIQPGGGGEPVLPHPRMTERLFVLRPLAEVAPDWIDPRSGRSVTELLAGLPPGQRCAPAEDRPPSP